MSRIRAVTATAVGLFLAVASGVAFAQYTYDYTLGTPASGAWATRNVAHNYQYISASVPSVSQTICVKLTRTTDASNYGDVYCNFGGTGHHYAGDTGTLSWGKNNFGVYTNLQYHEEW